MRGLFVPVKLATKCAHPHRPERARGLCGSCYNRWLASVNPEFKRKVFQRFKKWRQENAAWFRQWRDENADKVKTYQRATDLRRNFGMEPDEYFKLLESQGGVCLICKQPETYKGRKYLAVDHHHASGKIRGLLCARCNTGLGWFRDNVELLRRAAEYLEATCS